MSWKTIDTQMMVNDYHVRVKKNKVQLPDGAEIDDFYTVTIPDAAMVCAVTAEGNVLLKSEYRYACGEEVNIALVYSSKGNHERKSRIQKSQIRLG